jgi:hypothetical protein
MLFSKKNTSMNLWFVEKLMQKRLKYKVPHYFSAWWCVYCGIANKNLPQSRKLPFSTWQMQEWTLGIINMHVEKEVL